MYIIRTYRHVRDGWFLKEEKVKKNKPSLKYITGYIGLYQAPVGYLKLGGLGRLEGVKTEISTGCHRNDERDS